MAATVENSGQPEAIFKPIQIPLQKEFSGVPFPFVLSPVDVDNPFPCSLAEAVRAHKPWLEARLQEAGAVLFRGFGLQTASDFNDVVLAFGYDDSPFVLGGAKRTHIVGRVITSNEGPKDVNLHFHNEMAYVHEHPNRVFFYCDVEPETKGETPIVLGHVIYKRMREKHPEFMDRLEEHGLTYTRILPNVPDPTSMLGRGWQSTFNTNDKAVFEEKASKLGWKLEWSEDWVRARMGTFPGVKVIKTYEGERKVWFNSMVIAYMCWVDSRNEQGSGVKLGDGTLIPLPLVEDCIKILEEECVAFRWRQGDVLLIDNSAAQHARRPVVGPRRILASFCN